MNWNKKTGNCKFVPIILIIVFILPTLDQSIFASHGKEIVLRSNDAQFFLVPSKNVQQIKVTTTYSVSDPTTVGKQISGTMKIYTTNGNLLKTTSIPNGFKAENNGFQQFVTTLPNSTAQSITTIVLFTDLNKTVPFSNSITNKLVLNKTQ